MRPKNCYLLLVLCLLLAGCARPDQPEGVTEVSTPVTGTEAQLPEAILPPAVEMASGEETALPAGDPRAVAFYQGLDRGAPELLAYDAVMNGNLKLVDPLTGEASSLTNYLKWYDAQTPLEIRQLTVVDLDQNGELELILWTRYGTDEAFGFEILRHDRGQVYVYNLTYRAFAELKTDGTSLIVNNNSGWSYGGYTFADPRRWGSVPGEIYTDNTPQAQAAQQAHSEKADVIWFPSWEEFLYPGARKASDVIQGILAGERPMTDTATGQSYPISEAKRLLVPEEVEAYVSRYAMVDLEQDGEKEAVLEISSAADGFPIGCVILNQQGYGEGVYYRPFQELKVDGTYTFSSGASSRGFGRKFFDGSRWQEIILAECYPTTQETGQEVIVYFIGGEFTTAEEFAAYEKIQMEKEDVVWYDTWEACQAAG